MDKIYPRCAICDQIPTKGLFDGFRLNGRFICSVCEKRIITAESGDMEYLKNMRNIRFILYPHPRTITAKQPASVKK
ncbi:MAG: inhibitor of sigma-G Gin [Peptococcaceae bacterium]|jgi:hypothetical protein|nr:inhibitor of sigma-G Gin [Peptococcaceae bacterium]